MTFRCDFSPIRRGGNYVGAAMDRTAPSFFPRLWMAIVCFFRVLFWPRFAAEILPAYQARKQLGAGAPAPKAEGETPAAPAAPVAPKEPPPEQAHASSLFLLSMLQREGRLLDFVQEDLTGFQDADVGAAARVVHEGCRKVLRQYLTLEPVQKEGEGAKVTVPQGFDANRVRLTGNVAGQPPYTGTLKHPGWVATEVKLPRPPEALDLKVIAPAEVEL